MSSTDQSTSYPPNAFTAEYLITSGPAGLVALEQAGRELLAQARESIPVHEWPEPAEEGRLSLLHAAAELRQLAAWLENGPFVDLLDRQNEPRAAHFFDAGSAAQGRLLALAAELEQAATEADGEPAARAAPADGGSMADGLFDLLQDAARDLRSMARHLASAGEPRTTLQGVLLGLSALERCFQEHFLPTAHHLALEQAEIAGARLEPGEALQHHLAALAECLRLWVPGIRRLANRLKATLHDPQQLAERSGRRLPWPESLWVEIDGLIADSLCPAIADLETLTRLHPRHPDRRHVAAREVWLQLDPGVLAPAPPEPATDGEEEG